MGSLVGRVNVSREEGHLVDMFTQSLATSDGFMGYYSYGLRSFIGEKLNVKLQRSL